MPDICFHPFSGPSDIRRRRRTVAGLTISAVALGNYRHQIAHVRKTDTVLCVALKLVVFLTGPVFG